MQRMATAACLSLVLPAFLSRLWAFPSKSFVLGSEGQGGQAEVGLKVLPGTHPLWGEEWRKAGAGGLSHLDPSG